jgi:hypothetical protein
MKMQAQLIAGPTNSPKSVDNSLDHLDDREVVNMVRERFDVMYRFAQGSTQGSIRSLIISGAPGVGKSHTVEWVLESYGNSNPDFKYKFVQGAITPIELYKLLYKYRKEGNVVVLDDTDTIFFDEQGLSILKAALDSGTRRRISWFSNSHDLKDDDGNKIEQQFDYNGTMIFITNTDFQRYVDEGKSKLAPHFEALISRSIYLDLKLRGSRAVSLWVKNIVSRNNILVDRFSLTAQQQNDALDYIIKNRDKMRTLSIREALKLAQMIKSNPTGWEKDANITLLNGDVI